MEEGRKTKLLEEKLIASMKTEITLLKKLKHLASHRSDREGGCKSTHTSAQSSLQSSTSASDITITPWLNGLGTHVDRRKRAGPVHQSGLTVQPSSVIYPELVRCNSVEVLVTNERGAVNGSAGLSRPTSSHSNYSSDHSPAILVNEVDCDYEDSPSDDSLDRSQKLTHSQVNGSEGTPHNLKIPSTRVDEGYHHWLSQNGRGMTGRRSSSLDRDIALQYSRQLKDESVSVHTGKEPKIVRRSSLPTASKPPAYPKPKKKAEKQRQEETDDLIGSYFSTFQGLLATKPDHWLEKYLSQDWRSLCSDCSEVTEAEETRRDKVWEVLCTEVKYFISQLQPLRMVYKNFLVFLQNQEPSILSKVDVAAIFGNINDVYELSMSVAMDILKLFQFKPANEVAMTSDLVAVFRMFGANFNPVYQCFAINYERKRLYRHKLLSQPGYKKYLELCQSERLCHRLKLEDLLISPVKHLGHYPLLLKDIIRHTHDAQSESLLQSTLKAFSVALKELESRISRDKERLHLEDLCNAIHWPTVTDMEPDAYVPRTLQFKLSEQPSQHLLVMDGRVCLHEGSLKLIGSRGQTAKKLHGILLSDCLLLTEHKKLNARTKASVVHKEPISLQYVEVFDVGEDDLASAFCCVVSNVFKQHTALYTLQADSRKSKEVWLERLKMAQEDMSLRN